MWLAADAWFLTGATASGKTAVGVELARKLNAEIISLDSMSLYRGMNIGTAKPTAAERAAVPHHLLDVIGPDEEYSLAQFVAAAQECAQQISSRGRPVLFVGGTPLYLKSLLRGIFVGPPADWELRRELTAAAEAHGPPFLHEQLAAIDPAAAKRLHPRDVRRVVRAIEVFRKTGRPISDWQQQFEHAVPAEECRVFVLDWPREELYARIDHRAEAMFAAGLVNEVRSLLAQTGFGRTASQAVGYREVIEYLKEVRSLPETIELVKTRSRQFAKRQLTWLRGLSECRWLSVNAAENPAALAERVLTSAV